MENASPSIACLSKPVVMPVLSHCLSQSLVIPDSFVHILRVLNTNIDGKQRVMFGFTAIKVGKGCSLRDGAALSTCARAPSMPDETEQRCAILLNPSLFYPPAMAAMSCGLCSGCMRRT